MAVQNRTQIVAVSGGEVDDYTLARVDLDAYPTTAERMENLFLIEQGAMELAPGTRFLRATPDNGFVVLRPWAFNAETTFCLEFSDELLRFIQNVGYVTLPGAAATVADFTDASGVPTGGSLPPSGETGGGSGSGGSGGGSGGAMAATVSPSSATGRGRTGSVTCMVTGGSGSYSAVWSNSSGTTVEAETPTSLTTRFASSETPDSAIMVCTVTDLETGQVVVSDGCVVFLSAMGGVA